jgi:integrase
MERLVLSKRAQGYDWSTEAYVLWRLDRMCVESGFSGGVVTRELADAWASAAPGECGSSTRKRMGALRQLAAHEASLGLPAYVPRGGTSVPRPTVYLPTREETAALFRAIDAYRDDDLWWMADGYRVAFRLMRLCGMRVSECANMRLADVDAEARTLLVRRSKGDRDRLVYMDPAVAGMVAAHAESVRRLAGPSAEWLLPGRDPSRPAPNTTYDRRFAAFWDLVPGSSGRRKRPTPHSLRHAFVVDRMNLWMAEGVSLGQMMPYLAAYLGHSTANETMYYYHLAAEALEMVRGRGTGAARVIPEAISCEKQ